MTESQNNQILTPPELGYSLTSLEALTMFGCFPLASRIIDLKAKGNTIKTTMVNVGEQKKKVARYSIN